MLELLLHARPILTCGSILSKSWCKVTWSQRMDLFEWLVFEGGERNSSTKNKAAFFKLQLVLFQREKTELDFWHEHSFFFFEFLGASKNPGKKVFQWLQLPVLFEKMMENRTAFTLKAQHPKHMAEHVLSLFYFKDIKGDKPYTPKLQPWKVTGTQKERILFQPSFFRGYVRLCGVSRGLLPGEMVLGRS